MNLSCRLATPFPTEDIRKLLAAEMARTHERSSIVIEDDDGHAVITVQATDTGALRAAMNGVTSVLSMYEKTGTL